MRKLSEMTDFEAKKVIRIEMEFDRYAKPTKVKIENRTSDGVCFIVSTKEWADCRKCFSFGGRKCYKTYKYLKSRGFKL